MGRSPLGQPTEGARCWLQASVTHRSEADVIQDPGAIGSHIGVDTGTVGQGTALSPAHHAGQHPTPRLHAGQGPSGVPLQEEGPLSRSLPKSWVQLSQLQAWQVAPSGC